MKVLVTGAKGMLGCDVMRELEKRGHAAIGADVAELDITNAAAVMRFVAEVKPDAVINCAAWTAVDAAEDEQNAETVRRVNADGAGNLAAACKAQDCKLVHVSTDYVFDGSGETPWRPDDKSYKPLGVYAVKPSSTASSRWRARSTGIL